jgi:hypothetical protein
MLPTPPRNRVIEMRTDASLEKGPSDDSHKQTPLPVLIALSLLFNHVKPSKIEPSEVALGMGPAFCLCSPLSEILIDKAFFCAAVDAADAGVEVG